MTPLYDAIGRTIRKLEQTLDNLPKHKCPHKDKILFVILTDGQENASKEYSRENIFNLIKDKEKDGNWTFVYLGANQDSWLVAQAFGLQKGNVVNYNAADMKGVMRTMGKVTVSYTAAVSGSTNAFFKGMKKEDADEIIIGK